MYFRVFLCLSASCTVYWGIKKGGKILGLLGLLGLLGDETVHSSLQVGIDLIYTQYWNGITQSRRMVPQIIARPVMSVMGISNGG